MKKLKLFLDFDSTVVNSSEVAIDILNNIFNKHFCISDLKKYDFSDLYPEITPTLTKKIFESPCFYRQIKFIEGVLPCIQNPNISLSFVTKATEVTAKRKALWLSQHLKNTKSYKLYCVEHWNSKKTIDMSDGVFIDDHIDNLRETNAKIKILYAPYMDTEWTKYDNLDEIYVVSYWAQIKDILDFYLEQGEII